MSQIHILPTADVQTLNELSWNSQYTDPAQALDHARRAIVLAEASGDRAGLAYALLLRAFYELRFSPIRETEATLRETAALFEALQDKRGNLLVRTLLGGLLLKQNQFDAAFDLLSAVMAAPEEDRKPLDAYFALYRLGYIHFYRGEVQEGLRFYYRALALVQRERAMPLVCQALSDLGSCQMELGNYEEALKLLNDAHKILQHTPVCFSHLVIGNLASVNLEMGNWQAALAVVEKDFPWQSQYFQRGDLAFLQVVAAQAYAAAQRWDDALPLAQQAYALARAEDHPDITQQTLWMLGTIAFGTGDARGAIDWLRQAEERHHAGVTVFYILNIFKALAQAHEALGEYEHAFRYLKRYQEEYESSLGASSRARFYTLQIQHELVQAEFERDYALQQQHKLEALNGELHRKVEEIEKLQAALHEQVIRDPLTGLYNRRFLNEQIGPILDAARRAKQTVCVAMLDIDHFKNINDTYGHGFGDQVLIELAQLLGDHTRSSDLAVRYGGEEFCLVFPTAGITHAQMRMQFILRQFTETVVVFGNKSLDRLTFSAGVAEYPADGTTAAALLLAADVALYHAKNLGRNQVLQAQRGDAVPVERKAE